MITSQHVETRSFQETLDVGDRLGTELQGGAVVALFGELGAGKTALIKGIARGLGICQEVTSPTFTIVHEYGGGRLPLFHIDLYRLDSVAQAMAVWIEDYLKRDGVTTIEWAEKIEALLPANTVRVHITTLENNVRRIEIA